MIRVLQSVNIMDRAGLETMLMNYYRNIDRNIIQFDFLTHRPQRGAYDEEIKSMGGKVFYAPRLYPQHLPQYYKYMKAFYKEHPEYQIIHSHIDSMSYFPLKAAKKNGIPIRIAHSHSSKLDRDLKLPIKYYALKSIHRVANRECACGELAGNFMFPKSSFKIIHNAIDLDKFAYNEIKRTEIRKKLNCENKFVMGHVGRFCYVKNQSFLIELLEEIKKKRTDSMLILVGKGPDEEKLRQQIKNKGLEDYVIFLIDRSDVDMLYQAFDVFVMPSQFEGLPVVGVEAQANGLPMIVSDKVSSEIKLTSSVVQLSLDTGEKTWTDRILNLGADRNMNAQAELRAAGYDIKIEARKLQEWYIELSKSIAE